MTVSYDVAHRGWTQGSPHGGVCLSDKFEILKEIGDGSFGSVALARVRSAGSHVARRGTLVAVKTMKKTFESFAPCLELREIIFLRSLPNHPHLVPALDIFLDPLSKKLHIAMEYMDGNLYQLMKARDHKPFDGSSVKSILYQILSGLEHIHTNNFFHRDIKPENILVSVSAREDIGSAFKRYSQLVTPPSTPPSYSVKIADFGLARETHSRLPYTTYVSTRWYRAPEVLLRAGEYSAPVDIWAIGAMAVEVATLKPLFPGSNEVDQVWRVCEIMGSPGNWVNKQGVKVGGGSWKEGVKLAQKLGFSFPKMAPHTMDTILQAPQWPASMSQFITWCLMWDPTQRPTASQSLAHEYFMDAQDPLRPKSSGNRLLGRKNQDLHASQNASSVDSTQSLSSKTSSWFRKSLVARESAPAVPQATQHTTPAPAPQAPPSPRLSPVKASVPDPAPAPAAAPAPENKPRPAPSKRNTWTNSAAVPQGAPMPILPSIRPVSPLSNTVHAQARTQGQEPEQGNVEAKGSGKIGRQLSMASNENHYSEQHRQEAERALNGQAEVSSPNGGAKEGFFSHLRKRARRLSGRHALPLSPKGEEDGDSGAKTTHRSSALFDPMVDSDPASNTDFSELDRVLDNVRHSLEAQAGHEAPVGRANSTKQPIVRASSNPTLKQKYSQPLSTEHRQHVGKVSSTGSTRARRTHQKPMLPKDQYETPDEQEELLDEAMAGAQAAMARMEKARTDEETAMKLDLSGANNATNSRLPAPYPTPSPPAHKKRFSFGSSPQQTQSAPINIEKKPSQTDTAFPFPTPPYDENDWAAAAAASIFAASDQWR